MAPITHKWLQGRTWEAPTKGLAWPQQILQMGRPCVSSSASLGRSAPESSCHAISGRGNQSTRISDQVIESYLSYPWLQERAFYCYSFSLQKISQN